MDGVKLRVNIEEVPIDEIIPYENNPRINDRAVPALVESIKMVGFNVPLVLDGNNVVICGHTRLKAAEQLGLKTVPCVRADDLTEAEVKAFRLADNKTAELSQWDFNKLYGELESLKVSVPEFDASIFGFDSIRFESGKTSSESKQDNAIICPRCGHVQGEDIDED